MTLLRLMGAASQRRLIAVNKRAGQDLLTICGARTIRRAGCDWNGPEQNYPPAEGAHGLPAQNERAS
jgi:hypothetical protein